MTLQTRTKDLCTYNLWANHQLADRITAKQTASDNETLDVSFSGINEKLAHLLADEASWMKKMKQEQAEEKPVSVTAGAIDALLKDLMIQSESLLNYVSALSEVNLKEQVSFEIQGSGDFRMSRYEMIQYTIGYNTLQRGEIVSMVI